MSQFMSLFVWVFFLNFEVDGVRNFASIQFLEILIHHIKQSLGSNLSCMCVAMGLGSILLLRLFFPFNFYLFQVSKNEVRLSSNLSDTMGCPTSGSVVFIYPVQSQLPPGIVNGHAEPNGTRNECISIYNCKELYLEALSKNRSTVKSNMLSSMNFPAEKTNTPLETGLVSSPKTPLYQSKLSYSSPSHSASSICKDPVSCLPNPNSSSIDSFDIREVMGDASAKKLLQTCATTWLFSRNLLCGNLVAIPILSEVFIFRVIGAKELSAKSSSHDLINEKSNELLPEAPELVDHAVVINRDTKVCLYSPSTAVSETSFSGVELEYKDVKAKVVDNSLKLGGLLKEYAILKDIIISSSVKDTLSRYVKYNTFLVYSFQFAVLTFFLLMSCNYTFVALHLLWVLFFFWLINLKNTFSIDRFLD